MRDRAEEPSAEDPRPAAADGDGVQAVRQPTARLAALVEGDRDELRGPLGDALDVDRVVLDLEHLEDLGAGGDVRLHLARARDVLRARDQPLMARVQLAP